MNSLRQFTSKKLQQFFHLKLIANKKEEYRLL